MTLTTYCTQRINICTTETYGSDEIMLLHPRYTLSPILTY
jgi:hypothetical protein